MRAKNSEAGAYFLLTALFLGLVLLGLLAMMGFSIVIFNRVKHQNVSNLTALAGIAGYMSDNTLSISEREAEALARANAIVQGQANDLKFKQDSDTGHPGVSFSSSNGGEITLGRWDVNRSECLEVPSDPAACFDSSAGAGLDTNAVHVVTRTPSTNPILSPFARLLQYSGFELETEAYAGVRPRCVMFGLDISPSIVSANFRMAQFDSNESVESEKTHCYSTASGTRCVQRRALPIFEEEDLTQRPEVSASYFIPNLDTTGDGTLDSFDGDGDGVSDYPFLLNGLPACSVAGEHWSDRAPSVWQDIWCNHLAEIRAGQEEFPNDGLSLQHYRGDYQRYSSPVSGKNYWVNRYVNPSAGYFGEEPWYSVMTAMNGALRVMKENATSLDKAGMVVFHGTTAANGLVPLSVNLNPLIQATNPNNRGLIDALGNTIAPAVSAPYPNYIDLDWIPRLPKVSANEVDHTNLTLALANMSDQLTAPESCPGNALRIGVIATDGLMTCTNRDTNGDGIELECESSYDKFIQAIDEFSVDPDPDNGVYAPLTTSRAGDIRWIVLHIGQGYIDLHTKNVVSPDWLAWQNGGADPAKEPDIFLSFERAGQLPDSSGFNHNAVNNVLEFPHADGSGSGRLAFDGMWVDNSLFNGANGYLFELAKGGIYCPLQPPIGDPTLCDGDYELINEDQRQVCKLKDDVRLADVEQRPVYHMSMQDQAARCLLTWLGKRPYILLPQEGLL